MLVHHDRNGEVKCSGGVLWNTLLQLETMNQNGIQQQGLKMLKNLAFGETD